MASSQSIAAMASPSTHPRRRIFYYLRNTLFIVIVIALLLTAIAAATGTYFVQRTLPQTRGIIGVPGLHQPVSVVRDSWGVPHINGGDLHDIAFAQGYVTAQDRLFQMELNRRVAQGRLAEMFGAGTNDSLIHTDEFLRTLGLYDAARQEEPTLDARAATMYQAYADGVNAFITSHKDSLPLEFSILGITPQPWTVLDSLAYGRVIAYSLDGDWYDKYTRALLQQQLGPQTTAQLFPPYPTENPTLITASGSAAPLSGARASSAASSSATALAVASGGALTVRISPDLLQGAAVLHQLLGSTADSIGSNNWVVDGTRTTTGKPLLANDPHLGISAPAIWYEVALRGGGMDAIGFSFPGEPGIIVGHNDYISWGVTTTTADNTDLYREQLDPAGHPGKYEYNGQWLPLQMRTETVRVRGQKMPITYTITTTHHGPLLNSAVSDLASYAPVALQWTAIRPGYTLEGFLELDSARNWQEFSAAIRHISISQNFVYADVNGNIGYRTSGSIPIRPAANRLLPVDGSTSAYDWTGYIPQEKMPSLFNPPTHIILTANNRIVADNYPYYVSDHWDQGYRAHRIADLLTATPKLSISDFARIQADVYSVPAAELTPYYIRAGLAAGGDAATAAHILQGWNDSMTRESNAAALYEVTSGTLLRELLEPILGKHLYAVYQGNYDASGLYSFLIQEVRTPTAPFIVRAQTSSAATSARDAAIARALRDAMGQLRASLGPDPAKWQWGKLHTAHFEHPLATVQPLNLVFAIAPVARPGDTTTVNVGGDGDFSADPPSYAQNTIPSMREIIDLANLDNSRWVIPAGQSGQPYSAHYSDLLPLWDAGRYQQMTFTPDAVARGQNDILLLQP